MTAHLQEQAAGAQVETKKGFPYPLWTAAPPMRQAASFLQSLGACWLLLLLLLLLLPQDCLGLRWALKTNEHTNQPDQRKELEISPTLPEHSLFSSQLLDQGVSPRGLSVQP